MMKTKILLLISTVFLLLSGCEDVLDRPQLTSADDESYWVSEVNLRLYANEYYPTFFPGYGIAWGGDYVPFLSYTFSDDRVTNIQQPDFELTVPNSLGEAVNTVSAPGWRAIYSGPTWYFGWIRKSNLMIERINSRMTSILNDEQRNHWLGIARFFRAINYAGLVTVFGDVPYYDHLIDSNDLADMYKDRTPRNGVMDAVYDDLEFALKYVRESDGDQYVNRDVVAAYITRLMLFEGTWQKYHNNDSERAKKFLNFAATTAKEKLMDPGKYGIVTDFRSLFGSEDLKGNRDCIFYRHYSLAMSITHTVATNQNLSEALASNANLALAKAFICNDGKPWQTSAVANANKFDVPSLAKTRDPRFEATFHDKAWPAARSSALYATKFIDREGPTYAAQGVQIPAKYLQSNNTNDYPILRYAEVLLNWIEAKAELATLGGPAVSQADIDASINQIRRRPLDKVATDKGIVKTADMQIVGLPDDPDRDTDVPALIWEIRRERRMEFAFEYSRLLDLKRWKKIHYMNAAQYPDILKGIWVNIPVELPDQLSGTTGAANVGVLAVIKEDGTRVVYDGKNGAQMVGYFTQKNVADRKPFLNIQGVNVYLSPVGTTQRIDYRKRGFNLTQTEGWPQGLD